MVTNEELRMLLKLAATKLVEVNRKEEKAYREKRRREADNLDASRATVKMLDLQDELTKIRIIHDKLEKMYYNEEK
jgi:hypothetical protein